jgi:hypothetical protein
VITNGFTINTRRNTELVLPEGCPKDGNVALGKDNLLIFAKNGNVYFKGRLLDNDKEIVNGMREFLNLSQL